MFADAYQKGCQFTRPVITIWNRVDGECRSGVGSFVVVNSDGWFVSAFHIVKAFGDLSRATSATEDHRARLASINTRAGMTATQRKTARARLGTLSGDAPAGWVARWMRDDVQIKDVQFLEKADLLLGRLDPFDPAWITEYPRFKDPASPMRPGTSLCRIGYPFNHVQATCNPATKEFTLQQAQVPVFPIEGILTRDVLVQQRPGVPYRDMFLETSSPGLKGQSGGPILDVHGIVWGIQSNTQNLPLGFDPSVPVENGDAPSKRKEFQFLNVGWAVHPETIVGFLKEKGIRFEMAS